MFSWFSNKKSDDNDRFLALLRPGAVAVLSASCCNPSAHATDEILLGRLRAACGSAGVDPDSIRVETVTDAQKAIPSIMSKLDRKQGAIVQKLSALFMSNGMDAFPMVIIDGELAFYGGAPEQAQLEQKLRQMKEASSAAAPSAN